MISVTGFRAWKKAVYRSISQMAIRFETCLRSIRVTAYRGI
jgi:hypothetical protein